MTAHRTPEVQCDFLCALQSLGQVCANVGTGELPTVRIYTTSLEIICPESVDLESVGTRCTYLYFGEWACITVSGVAA